MNIPLLTYLISLLLLQPQSHDIPSSQRSVKAVNEKLPALTKAFNEKGLTMGSPVFVRIFKQPKELEVWVQKGKKYELFKTYKICTFSGGPGPKVKTGDRKSPEGFYFVKPNQLNPWSSFHLSFNIGYPNAYDRAHGYTGSALMVHGSCVSIGCYAMGDDNIEEIWTIITKAFEGGQHFFRVHIFPFKMTKENLAAKINDENYHFWANLKTGYDYFEDHGYPPNVEVKNKKYVFN